MIELIERESEKDQTNDYLEASLPFIRETKIVHLYSVNCNNDRLERDANSFEAFVHLARRGSSSERTKLGQSESTEVSFFVG